jgi:uncharacterized protein (TIGR02217 family)
MNFLEAQMDVRVTKGVTSTPTVPGRTKVYTHAGKLKQNYASSLPVHRYDAIHGLKSVEDFQSILDLWYVVHFTPYKGFRFKDWRDYRLTQSNSRLTFVSGSDWQINRLHAYGPAEFLRPIYKPVDGTIIVKRNRSGAISTATATIDSTTGIATISGHVSGDTYTCEGEFDMPVTFSDNEWRAELQGNTGNLFAVSGSIELEELKDPL